MIVGVLQAAAPAQGAMAAINTLGLFEYFQAPLIALVAIIALRLPGVGGGLMGRFERILGEVAGRPGRAIVLIVLLALALRGAAMPLTGVPAPKVADETSAFLQADTYLKGAFANRTRLTDDFESVFVNLSPTYASMYPVFRALPLALGGLAGLNFWAGVWASMIALCAATYWMLRAWIPGRYALVGALVVLTRYGVFSYWVNSYWGGAFTALGGVLLLGGYRRLCQKATLSAGAWTGLGALILMTTRPYEGLLFSAPFAVGLLVRLARGPAAARRPLMIGGAVAALLVAFGGAATVIDNQAVTGNWRVAPYDLYRQTTAPTPPFLFEKPAPRAQGRYYLTQASLNQEKGAYERGRTLPGFLAAAAHRLFHAWNFYVGFALTVPFFIGLAAARRDLGRDLGRDPTLLAAMLSLLAGLMLETWDFAHYEAPAFGVFILVTMVGLRRLRAWTPRGRPVGLALSRWLPLGLALGLWLPIAYALTGVGSGSFENDTTSAPCCAIRADSIHQGVERLVDGPGARDIIRVRGEAGAPITQIVVYNGADIARERVIWINADDALNPATIARFPGRRVWLLDWYADGGACLRHETEGPGFAGGGARDQALAHGLSGGWRTGTPGRCRGGFYHPPWPNEISAGQFMAPS